MHAKRTPPPFSRRASLLQERQEQLSTRILLGLAAAEERRGALREAERERLRAEHELVFSRLVRERGGGKGGEGRGGGGEERR